MFKGSTLTSSKMSLKFLVQELLRELKDGIGGKNRGKGKHWRNRARSHIAPVEPPLEQTEQGKWADMPPELLLDIIQRVEESETSWPARNAVVCCASVCTSWRDITKEIVRTPEECGRLTFPISLKQVMVYHCFCSPSCTPACSRCVNFFFSASSLVLVMIQSSALSEEIEHLPFFACTAV